MVKNLDLLVVHVLEQSQRKNQNNIIEGSCLDSYKLPKKADVVITSPPYANCFDYSKVYLIELWMGDFFCTREDQQSFSREVFEKPCPLSMEEKRQRKHPYC